MTERRGPQGRSTIIKRPDGRWHGYVSMGTKGDGKRDRRHVSARTRAETWSRFAISGANEMPPRFTPPESL